MGLHYLYLELETAMFIHRATTIFSRLSAFGLLRPLQDHKRAEAAGI